MKSEILEWTSTGLAPLESLLAQREQLRLAGKRLVTTNGCFDLLHPGHIQFLKQARSLGDVLIVGLNSDASVQRLKGRGRPLVPASGRGAMLLALRAVDNVVVFDDLLPNELLSLLKPDLHCKAGDYTIAALPEAAVVRQHGGEVRVLPLAEAYSTSRLIERAVATSQLASEESVPAVDSDRYSQVAGQLLRGANILRQTAYALSEQIALVVAKFAEVLSAGGKVLLCGNGGSAADAQHIAAEFVGRFRRERQSLPAIALTTDSSILTAVSNDYGFEQVFARQVSALGQPGDILVAISTGGTSANILAAVEPARAKGLYVIGLTGDKPSPLSEAVDLCLNVPATETAFIQQAHIAILHTTCDLVEQIMAEGGRW